MPRASAAYHASDRIAAKAGDDAYSRPSFSRGNKIKRQLWTICWALFYRLSWRPMFGWRSFLLRMFGAKLGPGCRFYPASRVWAPWNLRCEDVVAVADGAELYNVAPMYLGSHAIVSQHAYVCGATHDFTHADFPLVAYEMRLGAWSWIAARACVSPGVTVGEGAVLGMASVATKDLAPWSVYAGSPAVFLKRREHPLAKLTGPGEAAE